MTVESRIAAADLDLPNTLDCGQTFRWVPHGEWFSGWLYSTPVCLRKDGQDLVIRHSPDRAGRVVEDAAKYFDLDRDYESIRADAAARIPVLRPAMEFSRGLRVLRQDPWETLVCFIVSAYNNVRRITRCVGGLCSMSSGSGGFPTPEDLIAAGEDALRRAGLGYRAPYLVAAARMVADGSIDLDRLRLLPTGEARSILMTVPGVGGKVADCVLLYGLQRYEVVPVDVWVKRAIESMFGFEAGLRPEQARAWAMAHFGPYAGIVQACLFNYARRTGLGAVRRAARRTRPSSS